MVVGNLDVSAVASLTGEPDIVGVFQAVHPSIKSIVNVVCVVERLVFCRLVEPISKFFERLGAENLVVVWGVCFGGHFGFLSFGCY